MPSEPRHYDPQEMARRGRIGALRKHALYDPRESMQPAWDGFRAWIARGLDLDPDLPEDERERRIDLGVRAHMARMNRRSRHGKQGRP